LREWRPESCARFAAELLARHSDIAVILPRVPSKEADADEVARLCDDPRLIVAPPLPLLDFAALIGRALIVVTPDTGAVHLASACGRPVIALYTPTSGHLERWLPWGVPYRFVMARPGESVSAIEAGRIAAAFDDLFDGLVRDHEDASFVSKEL
jgi:ADP-heptose:LPS heptosyltransferase